MPPAPERGRLAASGLTDELLGQCRSILEEVASLDALPAPDVVTTSPTFDGVLVMLGCPLSESMQSLSRLRQAFPLTPLLVLAEGVDANFVAELLKCGAEDFLMLPPAPDALLRKVRRILGEATGPAFDTPEF